MKTTISHDPRVIVLILLVAGLALACVFTGCQKPERCEKYMHVSEKGTLRKSEFAVFDHLIDSNEIEQYLWFNKNRLINEPDVNYMQHFHSCDCPY